MSFGAVKRFLRPIETLPSDLVAAARGASVVLDRFAYDLYLSDVGHTTDVHDGDEFQTAARTHGGVDVYVVDGVDPRRSSAEQLAFAATDGRMIAGVVAAFTVDVLDS